MDLDKSQKDPIACLQTRSSISAIEQSTTQQFQSFQSCSDSSRNNINSNQNNILATNQTYQNIQTLISGNDTLFPLTNTMDSTYNYVSPADQVMVPNSFGDEEDFTAYDASFLLDTALPNEPLPFLAEGAQFPMAVDFPVPALGTPPLSGFDGYLAGNLDFDENLFNNVGDLSWGADMYNQTFATGMDNFTGPQAPSSASESQGFSPAELFLPYTPPEIPAFVPSSTASPSSATTNPSPPSSHQNTDRKPSSSTGPKRQLRKLIKPETCPVCGKGHAQLRERDRHIITHHYDDAVRMGLNVDRPQCGVCDQTFRRKDHLTRHMKRRHGW